MNVLVVMVTAANNIHQNTLIEYFMLNNVFSAIIHVLTQPTLHNLSFHAIFLLMVLVNYRKYESKNPYMKQLVELKDKHTLQVWNLNIQRGNLVNYFYTCTNSVIFGTWFDFVDRHLLML